MIEENNQGSMQDAEIEYKPTFLSNDKGISSDADALNCPIISSDADALNCPIISSDADALNCPIISRDADAPNCPIISSDANPLISLAISSDANASTCPAISSDTNAPTCPQPKKRHRSVKTEPAETVQVHAPRKRPRHAGRTAVKKEAKSEPPEDASTQANGGASSTANVETAANPDCNAPHRRRRKTPQVSPNGHAAIKANVEAAANNNLNEPLRRRRKTLVSSSHVPIKVNEDEAADGDFASPRRRRRKTPVPNNHVPIKVNPEAAANDDLTAPDRGKRKTSAASSLMPIKENPDAEGDGSLTAPYRGKRRKTLVHSSHVLIKANADTAADGDLTAPRKGRRRKNPVSGGHVPIKANPDAAADGDLTAPRKSRRGKNPVPSGLLPVKANPDAAAGGGLNAPRRGNSRKPRWTAPNDEGPINMNPEAVVEDNLNAPPTESGEKNPEAEVENVIIAPRTEKGGKNPEAEVDDGIDGNALQGAQSDRWTAAAKGVPSYDSGYLGSAAVARAHVSGKTTKDEDGASNTSEARANGRNPHGKVDVDSTRKGAKEEDDAPNTSVGGDKNTREPRGCAGADASRKIATNEDVLLVASVAEANAAGQRDCADADASRKKATDQDVLPRASVADDANARASHPIVDTHALAIARAVGDEHRTADFGEVTPNKTDIRLNDKKNRTDDDGCEHSTTVDDEKTVDEKNDDAHSTMEHAKNAAPDDGKENGANQKAPKPVARDATNSVCGDNGAIQKGLDTQCTVDTSTEQREKPTTVLKKRPARLVDAERTNTKEGDGNEQQPVAEAPTPRTKPLHLTSKMLRTVKNRSHKEARMARLRGILHEANAIAFAEGYDDTVLPWTDAVAVKRGSRSAREREKCADKDLHIGTDAPVARSSSRPACNENGANADEREESGRTEVEEQQTGNDDGPKVSRNKESGEPRIPLTKRNGELYMPQSGTSGIEHELARTRANHEPDVRSSASITQVAQGLTAHVSVASTSLQPKRLHIVTTDDSARNENGSTVLRRRPSGGKPETTRTTAGNEGELNALQIRKDHEPEERNLASESVPVAMSVASVTKVAQPLMGHVSAASAYSQPKTQQIGSTDDIARQENGSTIPQRTESNSELEITQKTAWNKGELHAPRTRSNREPEVRSSACVSTAVVKPAVVGCETAQSSVRDSATTTSSRLTSLHEDKVGIKHKGGTFAHGAKKEQRAVRSANRGHTCGERVRTRSASPQANTAKNCTPTMRGAVTLQCSARPMDVTHKDVKPSTGTDSSAANSIGEAPLVLKPPEMDVSPPLTPDVENAPLLVENFTMPAKSLVQGAPLASVIALAPAAMHVKHNAQQASPTKVTSHVIAVKEGALPASAREDTSPEALSKDGPPRAIAGKGAASQASALDTAPPKSTNKVVFPAVLAVESVQPSFMGDVVQSRPHRREIALSTVSVKQVTPRAASASEVTPPVAPSTINVTSPACHTTEATASRAPSSKVASPGPINGGRSNTVPTTKHQNETRTLCVTEDAVVTRADDCRATARDLWRDPDTAKYTMEYASMSRCDVGGALTAQEKRGGALQAKSPMQELPEVQGTRNGAPTGFIKVKGSWEQSSATHSVAQERQLAQGAAESSVALTETKEDAALPETKDAECAIANAEEGVPAAHCSREEEQAMARSAKDGTDAATCTSGGAPTVTGPMEGAIVTRDASEDPSQTQGKRVAAPGAQSVKDSVPAARCAIGDTPVAQGVGENKPIVQSTCDGAVAVEIASEDATLDEWKEPVVEDGATTEGALSTANTIAQTPCSLVVKQNLVVTKLACTGATAASSRTGVSVVTTTKNDCAGAGDDRVGETHATKGARGASQVTFDAKVSTSLTQIARDGPVATAGAMDQEARVTQGGVNVPAAAHYAKENPGLSKFILSGDDRSSQRASSNKVVAQGLRSVLAGRENAQVLLSSAGVTTTVKEWKEGNALTTCTSKNATRAKGPHECPGTANGTRDNASLAQSANQGARTATAGRTNAAAQETRDDAQAAQRATGDVVSAQSARGETHTQVQRHADRKDISPNAQNQSAQHKRAMETTPPHAQSKRRRTDSAHSCAQSTKDTTPTRTPARVSRTRRSEICTAITNTTARKNTDRARARHRERRKCESVPSATRIIASANTNYIAPLDANGAHTTSAPRIIPEGAIRKRRTEATPNNAPRKTRTRTRTDTTSHTHVPASSSASVPRQDDAACAAAPRTPTGAPRTPRALPSAPRTPPSSKVSVPDSPHTIIIAVAESLRSLTASNDATTATNSRLTSAHIRDICALLRPVSHGLSSQSAGEFVAHVVTMLESTALPLAASDVNKMCTILLGAAEMVQLIADNSNAAKETVTKSAKTTLERSSREKKVETALVKKSGRRKHETQSGDKGTTKRVNTTKVLREYDAEHPRVRRGTSGKHAENTRAAEVADNDKTSTQQTTLLFAPPSQVATDKEPSTPSTCSTGPRQRTGGNPVPVILRCHTSSTHLPPCSWKKPSSRVAIIIDERDSFCNVTGCGRLSNGTRVSAQDGLGQAGPRCEGHIATRFCNVLGCTGTVAGFVQEHDRYAAAGVRCWIHGGRRHAR